MKLLIKKIYYFLQSIYLPWKTSFNWLFIRLLPKVPSRHLRLFLLKLKGAKIGKNVGMFAQIEIRNPKGLFIDGECSIGPNVLLDARKGLHISKGVTIAYGTIIWTLQHDINDIDFHVKGAATSIEDHAWICSRSILLPGVTIGRCAVVASGSVVTKDVEPYSVVAGIPAKKIGERAHHDFKYSPYNTKHIV